jgi:hypothetical protein
MVIATGTTFASGVGRHLLSSVFGNPHTVIETDPVLVDSVAYINSNNPVFSFSRVLTTGQAHALTENSYFAGGQPKMRDWETYINMISHYGGAPSTVTIQVVLQGNSHSVVTIRGIQVVKQCGPPLSGTLLYSPSAGAPPDIRLWYNLDSAFPSAQYQTNSGKYFSFFSRKTIQLKPGEINTMVISPVTYGHFCRFSFRMTVDDGAREVTEDITNHGKPFVETAVAGVYSPHPLPFSIYKAMYAGGVASPAHNDSYIRVNPKRYNLHVSFKVSPSFSVPQQ